MIAFIGIASVLVITPGADTMLVLRSVLGRGREAGLLTVAGITAGCVIHATLSALGLSLIVMRSAEVFTIIKWAGALYLTWLGAQSVWHAAAGRIAAANLAPAARPANWASRSFNEGFLTNVLNPKVAIFYLAFLPQFVRAGDNVLATYLLLAGIHMLLGGVWLGALTLAIDTLRKPLTDGRVRRWLEGVTGAALMALGARLAVERR
jgi:RhtB (resistance to homoserine/threonine) family protein